MQNVHQTMNAEDKADISPASRHKPIIIATFAALGAGLTASLTSVALMAIWRLIGGVPTPVELFGDHLLKLLPAARFVDMLVAFSPHSKTTPLGLALLDMIGLGTLLGLPYAAIDCTGLIAFGGLDSLRGSLAPEQPGAYPLFAYFILCPRRHPQQVEA
jgi:hypothetical protein